MDLSSLSGEELNAVEFVEKHVQFRFANNDLLTLYTWPDVADADGISIGFGQLGYRDALCGLIGESVTEPLVHDHTALTIEFENGMLLVVSLREEDLETSEVGSFASGDGTSVHEF